MLNTSFWLFSRPSLPDIERQAKQAETLGFDGMTLTDSQNLSADTYVALTLAARATQRLLLGPGVTNPLTRHAAVTAGAIASIHALSGGRAVLGIGRGDSALFNIGHEPAKVGAFEAYVSDVQTYLRGDGLDIRGYDSRLRWLDAALGKVPMDIAATGPRVIGVAARHADRVTFAVGADVERTRSAIATLRAAVPDHRPPPEIGLYVNVCVDEDLTRAADMVRGGVGTFAHFSGMHTAGAERLDPQDRATFQRIGAHYERPMHGHGDAAHARDLPLDFIQRFAIIGPAAACLARLQALAAAGVQRFVVIGPRLDHFGAAAEQANQRFAHEVMAPMRNAAPGS